MWLRNYSVISPTGALLKMGSTITSLQQRARNNPYKNPEYTGCVLRLDREDQWPDEDRDFGILFLRVREQIAISKAHLWRNEGGRNSDEPVLRNVYGIESPSARDAHVKAGKKLGKWALYHGITAKAQPLAVKASHAIKDANGKSVHAVAMGKIGRKYINADERLAARRKIARDWATRNRRRRDVPIRLKVKSTP